MPQQSKSVFYGAGNVGEAVVYDREAPNLFELMDKKKEEEKLAKVADTKKKDEAAKELDFKLGEIYRADEEVVGRFNGYSDAVAKAYKDGTITDPMVKAKLEQDKIAIEKLAQKTVSTKKLIEEAEKTFQANAENGLIATNFTPQAVSSIYDENGKIKPVSEWGSIDNLVSTYTKDPNNWDYTKVIKRVNDILGKEIRSKTTPDGRYLKTSETETPSYVKMVNGKAVTDKNGDYIYNITPELVDLIKKTDGANVLAEAILVEARKNGDESFSYTDAVEALLKPVTSVTEKEGLKESGFAQIAYKHGLGVKEKLKSANNFLQQMSSIFNGSFKTKPTDPVTLSNGKVLQEIENPMIGKVLGKHLDETTGKTIDITGTVFYDYEEQKFYLKRSHKSDGTVNDTEYDLLDNTTLPKIIEAFPDQLYREAIVSDLDGHTWLSPENNFVPESATSKLIDEAKTAKEQATVSGAKAKEITAKTNAWITENTEVINNLINTDIGGAFVYDATEVVELNKMLKTYPSNTKATVTVGTEKREYFEPKINVNYDAKTINIEALDKNGNEISETLPFTPATMQELLQPKPNYKDFTKKTTSTTTEQATPAHGTKPSTTTELSEEEWNTKWSSLKQGESLVGLDGITYIKK